MKDNEPLFKYLNPDIIKQYADREIKDVLEVNEHVTVQTAQQDR